MHVFEYSILRTNTLGGGGGERVDEMYLSVFHSVSNRAHGMHSRNSVSSAARYTFNSFFFFLSQTRDCTTFTLHDLTDFYIERVTAHRIKRNDHSCFHNSWPNSKTKLQLKHLWEQGAPWCFGGPTQLAYSAYREDRLWVKVILSVYRCVNKHLTCTYTLHR